MGASLWVHFGPYDPDLRVAFEKTCEQVFRDRAYLQYLPPAELRALTIASLDQEIAEQGLEQTLNRYYNAPDDGDYIIVYADGQPDEIFFFGATGD